MADPLSASIYFYAGDFQDVLRRYDSGNEQLYATHNEVAKLLHDLKDADLTIYSFVTPEAREVQLRRLRIVSLGARDYSEVGLLTEAVANDTSDKIVAHFAPAELLSAVIHSGKRSMAVLANSYNRKGLRASLERRKIVRLLNNPAFEIVSNHCAPATEHLAAMGVDRSKLVAWDVPHRFEPAPVKQLVRKPVYTLAYAGSIIEDKGVGDLIRAVAKLRRRGLEVRCSLAGGGAIEDMKRLGSQLGVSDLLSFEGLIANGKVFQLFRDADVVAVPSRTVYPEGFPLTLFEAFASRTPIVATAHPMFKPILDNVSTGRLADAIQRVLLEPGFYERLSKAGVDSFERMKGPADWRTMIREWIIDECACSSSRQTTLAE